MFFAGRPTPSARFELKVLKEFLKVPLLKAELVVTPKAKVGCLLHVSLASWESRMHNLDEHFPHSLWQRVGFILYNTSSKLESACHRDAAIDGNRWQSESGRREGAGARV